MDHRTGPRLEWKKDSEATLHCAGSSMETLDGSGYAHTHDCITLCRTVEHKAHKDLQVQQEQMVLKVHKDLQVQVEI